MDKVCGLGSFLSGTGSLLTGIAACLAVLFAKGPVTDYLNNINVVQTVIVNTCEAKKQVDELIQKSNDQPAFESLFKQVPEKISETPGQPMGLFILPEYRAAAKSKFETAVSPEQKRLILENYWEKSLSKETKSNVDLNLKGN